MRNVVFTNESLLDVHRRLSSWCSGKCSALHGAEHCGVWLCRHWEWCAYHENVGLLQYFLSSYRSISGTKKRGANSFWSGVGKRPVANGRVLEGQKYLSPSWAIILMPVLSPIIQHLHQTLFIFLPNLFKPSTVCTSIKEKSSPPPLRVPCSLQPAAKCWPYVAARRATHSIRHLLVQCLGNTEPWQYP